jgi:hypothetical protein
MAERTAMVAFHDDCPLDGYRRLTVKMLYRDVVAKAVRSGATMRSCTRRSDGLEARLDARTLEQAMRGMVAIVTIAGSLWHSPVRGQVTGRVPVPLPEVSGPIAGRVFFATLEDLAQYGYVEEEFFVEGTARTYDLGADTPPATLPTDFGYRTRVVVRRPIDPARFNGTVLLEWLNVTVGFDIDIDWILARQHILRSGYAWVGVSAQRVGVHGAQIGLRDWAPDRYGSLDLTADSTVLDDAHALDIYAQVAAALRNETSPRILGPLTPEIVLATGHSQSASRLVTFYNHVQPVTGVIDGFVIHGGGRTLASGVGAKAFRVNAETDLWRMGQVESRQPDSNWLRTWEVAGASHADEYYMSHLAQLQERDFGSALTFQCDRTPNSRIPFHYALHAVYDHLDVWVRHDTEPPRAPRIELASVDPEVIAARDSLGNAMGGVRLPDHDVPIAMNSGRNSGGQFCAFFGAHEPFDAERLARLYPTPDVYLEMYTASVQRALDAGWILEPDAQEMLERARRQLETPLRFTHPALSTTP